MLSRSDRPGGSRRKITLVASFLGMATVASGVSLSAFAAEEDPFYDVAALQTSCAEEVDGLGKADRCRFEPATKENFTGDVTRVSGDTVNCTDVNATKSISWSQTTGEENSIQVSATAALTLTKDVFTASITTTYGHSWSTSTTETSTETAPVPARSVAWIERGVALQRVTGRLVINYPKRRHGHFEWYVYPTLTNADPEALGFAKIILRARPITPAENAELCGGVSAATVDEGVAPPPSETVLHEATPPATTVTGSIDTSRRAS